ncbi:MAG: helix-turn-helix domain-containing protein [Nitrospira sp. SB0662_bin_26]|nr:helix-turn-helix domain-containing protein [Nitrospira sp. SB0662_bin_26]
MNTLTERIRTARKEAGLSQADVAKALHISPSAVNQWEQGLTKNMKLNHFFALASLLGQEPRWLATGKIHSPGRESVAKSPKPDYGALTSEEKALLHQIRRMPSKLRRSLLQFLRAFEG